MVQHLSPLQKRDIIEQLSRGESERKVAARAGCALCTVQNIWKKWRETGSTEQRARAGRPHTLSGADEKAFIKLIEKKRSATAADLTHDMQRITGRRISERTIKRERHELGFHTVHGQKRPHLQPGHPAKRLAFAQAHLHTDWKYTVFDDETQFGSTTHGILYWIRKGEQRPYEPVSQIKYFTGVWAAVSWDTKFPLRFYKHGLKANEYIEILEHNLLPHYPQRTANRRYYFAHDNATPHVAQSTVNFLEQQHIPLLSNWPPNTPELNPVDKAWAWIKHVVQQQYPQTQAQLETSIEQAWQVVPQSTIQKWILHCKTVCQQLVDNQGGTIPE